MRIARRFVVSAFVLAIALFVSAGLAQADDTAWKAAHDTDPHLPLTTQQLEMTAQKRAAQELFVSGLAVLPMAAPERDVRKLV